MNEDSDKDIVETLEITSDPETMLEIAEALDEYDKEKGKTLYELEKELGI